LDQQSEFLSTLLSSAHKLISALKSQLDQRRNIPAYRVMQDIAAIFEWLTGRRAVRRVERGNDTFGDFARAIWPVILNRADDGLESALKNWAKYRNEYGEESALIANIGFRHPAWRVCDRRSPNSPHVTKDQTS